MKNLQIRLTRLPNGTISPGDLTLVETETPPTGKGQMLCRTRWLSLEPLHGCNARDVRPGEVLPAQAVCEVVESRNEVFNAGDIVVMETGLQNYRVSDGVQVHRVRTGSAPLSAALGIMGEPGLTAYCGLLDLAHVRERETVLVSAAAGPVGSMVGQIARIKGCKVIGIAAGREASEWCLKEGHFSACINPLVDSLDLKLRKLAPRGVDVYFDCAGGEVFNSVVEGGHVAPNGRVVTCVPLTRSGHDERGRVLPVSVREHEHRREAFLRDAIAWFAEGHLRYREHVVEGLQNGAAHFCRMVAGELFGRALVKA
jgi:NADPH-dependent curcumin reductase CurA